MKKNYKIFLSYLILLFTFIFLYSCENKHEQTISTSQSLNPDEYDKIDMKLGGKSLKISLNYKINAQVKSEREFVELKTTDLFKIGNLNDTTFYYATFVRSDESGNIYVLDMAECSIKIFNSDGAFIRKYGRRGRGPGEFLSPFRMDVTPSGKLLVLDPNLHKCELFVNDESKQFKLSSMPIGICFADSTSFVTLQVTNPFDNSSLVKHNIVSGTLIECDNLILNTDSLNLGPLTFLQGEILNIDKNNFIYVPFYMNHFVKYSNEGKIILVRNSIDNKKLPSIIRDNSKLIDFRLPNEYISSLYAFIIQNELYNVSKKATKSDESNSDFIIDVYDLDNIEYLYSFILPNKEKIMNIFMDKKRIYLLNTNQELEVLSYTIVK